MQSHQKNNVTPETILNVFIKETYENYLSDEGITVFENSKKELIEKAKRLEEMFPVIKE